MDSSGAMSKFHMLHEREKEGPRNSIWKLYDFTNGRYDSLVFKELGFEDFLKEKAENISVNWNSLLINGSKESIKRVVKEFEDRIKTSEIEITDMPGIQRLFFNDDHGPNDRMTAYIQSGISRNKISKYYYHCWNDKSSDSTLKGIVYCRSKDDALTIKSIIEKGFCSFTLADYSKDVKLLIDEWKNKRKLVEMDDAVKGVIITCTQDVRSKIEKEHNKDIRKDFPVSAVIAKFLGKRQALLSEVGNSFGIDIYFDSDQSKLSMYGPYPAIKQALDEIKSKQVKDTMSIPAQPSSTLSWEFDRIADEHQCGWVVKVKGPETEVKSLDSCEYIATWYDPRKPGKLTVIEGETHNLNVDCLIILCTDSLFPLQITPDEEMHRVITDHISSAYKPNLGSIFISAVKDTNYKHVLSLVVGLSNASDKFTNKKFHCLASQFKAIFRSIESKALKTVCLPAYIEEEFLSTAIIVDAYLEAVIACQKDGSSLQFYLYCDWRKLTAKSLLRSIQKRYKKEVGFSRKIHQHGIWDMKDLLKTGKPKIEVENGSIEHVKVDIIVNTTSTNLDLRRGIVSQRLLELAGEEILRECQEKYPRGINYSTIAVTKPWKLRQTNKCISYVFHGAIPKFTRETFVQNVQSFVRSCLAEADERECKSIAFPALGTGSRGYPGRETAKAMFDAVTTYGDETLNPYVKRVIFSLYEGDIDICKVFQGETSRRNVMNAVEKTKSALQPWTENKTNVQLLKGTTFRSPYPVEVIIGARSAIDPLQSNVVEIKFVSSEEANIQWKYSNEDPQANNDQLIVSDGQMDNAPFMSLSFTSFKKPEDSFKRAVVNAINYCVDNKIAEIAFDVKNVSHDLADDVKVKVIVTQLERILSAREKGVVLVLHTAYIRLMDTIQFEVVKKSTLEWKSKAHQFMNTVNPWGSTLEWKIIDNLSEDKLVEVQIIGESVEVVQMVKWQMEDASEKTFCLGIDNRISTSTNYEKYGAKPKTNYRRGANIEKKGLQRSIHRNVGAEDICDNDDNDDDALEENFGIDISHEDPADKLMKRKHAASQGQKEVQKDKGPTSAEIFEMLIEMEECEARAVMKLYSCNEIHGLKKWEYNSESRYLSLTYQNTDKQNLETEIRKKFEALYKKECDFHDDPDSFMLAENVVLDMEVESQAYFGVIPQESKIVIFGKDDRTAQRALKEFLSKVKGDPVEAVPSTLGDSAHEHFIQIRENKIKVWMYCNEITKLSVEAVAIPANNSHYKIRGLQKVVLEAAGQSVMDEYISSLRYQGLIPQGDFRRTSAGSLPCRHLFHVYLPQLQKIKDDINANSLLEKALVTVLTAADREKDKSIGLPFIGSGNAGYELEICAKMYYKAVMNKTWEPKHLQEIHFVSNNKDEVETVRKLFLQYVKDSLDTTHDTTDDGRQESLDKEVSSDFILIGSRGKVKLFVTKGHLEAVEVDAIACHQNKFFTSNHSIVVKIYSLCGEGEKRWLLEERGKSHHIGTVYEMPIRGAGLTCRSIFHVVLLPYSASQVEDFEDTLEVSTYKILRTVYEKGYKSIALPFLGQEGHEGQSVTECRCHAFVKGILKYVDLNPNNPIPEIHFLDERDDIVEMVRAEATHWNGILIEAGF